MILFAAHHPLHPLCSRLIPWCHVPCAVHLCLLAQKTLRSSSSCAGVLLASGYTQVQGSLAAPTPLEAGRPRRTKCGPWWDLAVPRSTAVLRSTSCLGARWCRHLLKSIRLHTTPYSYWRILNTACSLYAFANILIYTHVDDEDGRPHHHLCQVLSNSAQSMDPAKLLFLTGFLTRFLTRPG